MFLFRNRINEGLQEYRNTKGAVLVDVREPEEYRSGHIPGAMNIPLGNIEHLPVDKSTPVFVYCLRGSRSRRAQSILKQAGFTAVTSIGGISQYRGPIEK
ncbi:MAG: rhodanese-like domain-containing protein [Clostridia bacterium]|nr:rhodanese-like domain-containing protein [Clostridia bacterium]